MILAAGIRRPRDDPALKPDGQLIGKHNAGAVYQRILARAG
jgi:hypothetical protein